MTKSQPRPLIRDFMEKPMSGPEIEARSMEIIKDEVGSHPFSEREWPIVSRMIHTTGDLEIAKSIRFSPDAIISAVTALRNCRPIIVDSTMIRSGISLPRLQSLCKEYKRESIVCHIADEDIEEEARRAGLPRSLFAIRKARSLLDGSIAAFGNAPVALMELNRMILEEGIKPAVIIAMPVGFVHVVESKEELMKLGLPYIAIAGRRGGSPLAVSVIHALCGLASEMPRG